MSAGAAPTSAFAAGLRMMRRCRPSGKSARRSKKPAASVSRRYAVRVSEAAVELDGWHIESVKLARAICAAPRRLICSRRRSACRRTRWCAGMRCGGAAASAVADAVCSALIEDYCDDAGAACGGGSGRRPVPASALFPGLQGFCAREPAEIFSRLACEKRIGLTLTDTLMMVPFKVRHGGDRRHRHAGVRQ